MKNPDLVESTSIVFNERLVFAVLTLHEQNPENCIELLKSPIYTNIEKAQKIIRSWFIKNQHMFDIIGKTLTETPKHMPNFYALLCLNVCDITQCKSWDCVAKQFKNPHNHQRPKEFIIFCKFPPNITQSKCACSHSVNAENSFMLKHKITNLHIMLGGDCGQKIGISKPEYNQIEKPHNYELLATNRKIKNKLLLDIKKKNELKWKNIVSNLLTADKLFRKCLDCKKYNISKNQKSYIIRCKPCWCKHTYPTQVSRIPNY